MGLLRLLKGLGLLPTWMGLENVRLLTDSAMQHW
jgi:hypothetical protein